MDADERYLFFGGAPTQRGVRMSSPHKAPIIKTLFGVLEPIHPSASASQGRHLSANQFHSSTINLHARDATN